MYDLLIRNGRIIDGTGAAAYAADVGVAGGEIAAIGSLDGDAAKSVDASGLVVTPPLRTGTSVACTCAGISSMVTLV